ncbi:MAG: hypothetical protein F6K35_06155 [Okeania sp. SIO2H7]|nr:hypothetical protein [Okeania sp. SIO2H7]
MSQFITKITEPKLLIGEGIEEKRLFSALIKKMGITDIQITHYGGKNNLGNFLETLILIPGFDTLTSLGITRDADNSKERAEQSICTALTNNNLPLPNNQKTATQPLTKLSISTFIVPDNKNEGMLEDLCLLSVNDDPGMSCLEEYFKCIQTNTGKQPKNLAKAKIHASLGPTSLATAMLSTPSARDWLASQDEPDKRLAEAAETGYWNWDSQAFDPLKQFILSL